MKLQQLAVVAGISLATMVSMPAQSQAVTLILQNAKLATPPTGTTVFRESADGGLTNPGDLLNINYTPNNTSSTYAINDSAFNFTKLIYTILPGQDAFWSSASKFDFFTKSEISANGKVLTLSDGVFASGATALFSAISLSNDASPFPTNVSITFDGKPVPEPITILGTLAAGAFGVAMKKKKLAANKA